MKSAKTQQSKFIRMPKWKVSFDGWMDLEIEQFHIEPTYLDVLMGSTDTINRMIIKTLPERVSRILCAADIPVSFVKPTRAKMKLPFPDYLCIALAISEPVKNQTYSEEDDLSRVACCWFASNLNHSIEALILDGIRPFDWDKIAQNSGI